MTAPMPPQVAEMAGLRTIIEVAALVGVDLAQTMKELTDLMTPNPVAMQDGGNRLNAVASGLDITRQDVQSIGNGVQTSGWTGQTREAFGPYQERMVGEMAGATEVANQIVAQIDRFATAVKGGQDAVVQLTAATGAALALVRV